MEEEREGRKEAGKKENMVAETLLLAVRESSMREF